MRSIRLGLVAILSMCSVIPSFCLVKGPSCQGIYLEMTEAEVVQALGKPTSRQSGGMVVLEYWQWRNQNLALPIQIELNQGKVETVNGSWLELEGGRELVAGDSREKILAVLGKPTTTEVPESESPPDEDGVFRERLIFCRKNEYIILGLYGKRSAPRMLRCSICKEKPSRWKDTKIR